MSEEEVPRIKVVYSQSFEDGGYIYRYVTIPYELGKLVPKTHFMTAPEWRKLGIRMTPGWTHFKRHHYAPHILVFRRPKYTK